MTSRRAFIGSVASIFVAASRVGGQAARRVARVVLLNDGLIGPLPRSYDQAFRATLHSLGWIEGQGVIIDERYAEGPEQRREIAREMERSEVDVVVASSVSAFVVTPRVRTSGLNPQSLLGSAPIHGIPIVFVGVSDPVGAGMVTSLARPGGSMTGLSFAGVELNVKRLQLLREALPRVSRVGVLVTANHALRDRMVTEIQAAALALNVRVQMFEVASTEPPSRIDDAFDAIMKYRAEAVLGLQGPHFYRERNRIGDLLMKHRLPGLFEFLDFVETGALMGYGASLADIYRRAAYFVDKILRGAKPADLPVEQPTKFELVINLKTAKTLGLTIPPSLLLRADQVIE